MLECVTLCFVFRVFFCLMPMVLFHPFFVQAKKKATSKTESLTQEEPKASLLDLLNDTNQLKNDIKRDLAKNKKKTKKSQVPSSQKKTLRFGNMGIRISERKAEETLKDVPDSEKKEMSKQGVLNLGKSSPSKKQLKSVHRKPSAKKVSKSSKKEKSKREEKNEFL